MLTIRLIGAVEAAVDGAPVDLSSAARARALLAWLALHPGPHARGELAGRLRPDVPEESARKSLRQAVWALRGALGEAGGAALVADRDRLGLAQDAERVDVDLWRVRRLAGEGDLAAAVAAAGAGELLAGLDDEWVHAARETHHAELRDMLARLSAGAADAGDLAEAIAWARRRVAEDAHNETAARELMALLARSGDRAGAMAAADALRERLRRDLGIVPSAETRELVEQIRGGRPAAAAAAGSTPTPLPPPLDRHDPFVGRADVLSRLGAAWRDAAGGTLRLALLSGEPGIGKTRTCAALAAQVHAAGATVLYGRCDEDALVPHQPFVEALERHLRALPAPEREAVVGTHRGRLSRVLPALGPGAEGPAPDDDAETARYRSFEAVRAVVRAVAAQRPTLLVLDDLHWADRGSLMLIRHLARMDDRVPLLVLGTFRDTEVGPGHPLGAALGDMRRDHPIVTIPLQGLDDADVVALVAACGGAGGDAAALGRRARGNPLLLGELLRHEDAGEAVPASVVDLVGRRVDRLGAATADVLATAALLGTEFPPDVLEEVHGPEALEALDAAARAGLVAESDPATGRHAFGHALVAEALADRLSPPLRRRRHRRIAEVVVARAERDPATHAAEAARHLHAALPDGDREAAVRWSAAAAERASALLADDEAAEHHRRALAALPEGDGRRAALLAALGDAADRAGDRAGARAAFDEAGRLARESGDPLLQARAALGAGGLGVVVGPRDAALTAALEEALDALPDGSPALRARLLGRLAIEDYYADRGRAEALSAEAVDAARASRDPGALAAALNARRVAIWDIDHVRERLDAATEMAAVAAAAGEPATLLQARAWRIVDLMELGRIAEVRAEVATYGREADLLGLPHFRWWAPLWRGTLELLAGDFAAAARHGADALALGRRADDPNAALHVAIQEVQVAIDTGRVATVDRALAERGAATSGAPWAWRAFLAYHDAAAGRREEALAIVDDLARDDFAAVALDANWHAVGDLSEALAALGSSQAGRARALHDRLEPYAGLLAIVGRGAACYGPLDYFLGLLAATAGDAAAAAAHLERAVGTCEDIGAGPRCALARARLQEARAALRT